MAPRMRIFADTKTIHYPLHHSDPTKKEEACISSEIKINVQIFHMVLVIILILGILICRCFQISPERRPGCQDLLNDPWLKQYHQPVFTDLTLLPTTVIRILNVEDASNNSGCSLGETIMEILLCLELLLIKLI